MNIIDKFLNEGQYFKEETKKTTIYLHHTAGSHRPDWVIDGWKNDPTRVATAFVIGGISTTNGDKSWDGVVYRAFPEQYWAHHLGTTLKNNKALNQASIGIELCNYGPLRYNKGTNQYFNYVNKPVPKDQVIELEKPYRGYLHYHAYTDQQILATKELIVAIFSKFKDIAKTSPLVSANGFEFSYDAWLGRSAIYSHSSIRKDKFDVVPQPKLINMIKEICS